MKVAICSTGAGTARARQEKIRSLGAWWVQFGDQTLLYAAKSKWPGVATQARQHGFTLDEQDADVPQADLYLVVQKGRLFQQEYPNTPVLLDKGRYLAVRLAPEQAKRIGRRAEPCFALSPLKANSVIFDVQDRAAMRGTSVAWVQNLVDSVGRAHVEPTLTHLVSYPTRHSTSSHYANAATWCRDQLAALGYTARLDTVSVGSGTSYNVVADKQGNDDGPRDLVVVVAHLDSVNTPGRSSAPAPGADDNGSGSTGLLEMARVLKNHRAVHDLRLVLFGGEEQGLHGSTQYVAGLPTTDRDRIRAIVNMDMIGTQNTTAPTVLVEGATVSQSIIDGLSAAAATYTTLTVQTSLSPYASDHVPFINAGLPAVLTIEGADSANSNIHTDQDTLAHIDYDLAVQIIKLNVAYIATQLERKGGTVMLDRPDFTTPELTPINILDWISWLRPQLSGRYSHNGGASARTGRGYVEMRDAPSDRILKNPIYNIEEPIFIPPLDWWHVFNQLRFTLHVDIDGTDPLNVVSGTVSKGLYFIGTSPPHFIGQVTSNTSSGSVHNLVVENFSFAWPQSSVTIDRLEIAITGKSILIKPTAEVTFISTGTGQRFGPYSVTQESIYFREVEVEVDREDSAIDAEPYDTHTHPDRPADLPQESLTLEEAFRKSGIRITRSANSNVINTDDVANSNADNRWTEQELHDAMESHWSAFANRAQWKMWIFLAELGSSDGLGGVMFDGYIDEPGGVDRQGTALFTLCPYFHTAAGGYPQANPPAVEAVERELFFNLIHETGHAFNLAHSFQKQIVIDPGDAAWTPPTWMPLTSDDNALSWMNYPDRPTPGANATWFYDRFRFRFDDNENLFLRHAPASYVQMGNAAWFQNHGRVARNTLDHRLHLLIRSLKPTVELGEPVVIELRLSNKSKEPVTMHRNLKLSDGFVEVAVTNPRGERRPVVPLSHTRVFVDKHTLQPGAQIYEPLNLTTGQFGFLFKEPGPYRIEASYTNFDGSTAAAVMQIWVRPPANYDDHRVLSALYHGQVARTLYFNGSRVLEEANHRIDWVRDKMPARHPLQNHLAMVRAQPLAQPAKSIPADAAKVKVLDQDPDEVYKRLNPVVAAKQMEEAANTIGHITYHRVVDMFTTCAESVGKKAEARDAQKNLLDLFKERNVVRHVITDVEKRVKELS